MQYVRLGSPACMASAAGDRNCGYSTARRHSVVDCLRLTAAAIPAISAAFTVRMPVLVILAMAATLAVVPAPAAAQLSPTFYDSVCPTLFSTIQSEVQQVVTAEPRMGASLIRLFFHDCFVNGCDGGILLDDTATFTGEKTAAPNNNSVRGYDVIERIKINVDADCGVGVVSCADIVAVAARDSVEQLGGPSYVIPVGRRDARTASQSAANSDLPGFFENLPSLIKKFGDKGFTAREMVVLSGAHTVGSARCVTFRDRIYNETNIDPAFATSRRANCPRAAGNPGDDNLAPLDAVSPDSFGNEYFAELVALRGLLHSDQVLFNNGSTDADVTRYSNDGNAFATDFANAMIKMGNISPLTGTQGEIRNNCSRVN